MKLKKHHTMIAILAVLFVLAWTIWTFVWIPGETAAEIDPAGAAPLAPVAPAPH